MKTLKNIKAISLAAACLIGITACASGNEAGTRVGNPPTIPTTSTAEAYPTNFAVTSPLESGSAFSSELPTSSLSRYATTAPTSFSTAYAVATNRINVILEGTSISDCAFLIAPILNMHDDAACYGPSVAFQNHPDFVPPTSQPNNFPNGTLPPGDLGIWTENERDTPEACAAAELNGRMRSLQFKSQVTLEALASLICVARVDEIDLPDSGSSISLLSNMNDMATANSLNVEFTTADLSVSSSGTNTEYGYDVAFAYADRNGNSHNIAIQMAHVPLDSAGSTYQGRFSYVIDNVGRLPADNCPSGLVTEAGSVLYNLASTADLNFQASHASYCDSDNSPVQSDGLIHADDKYNMTSNPDGWRGDFTSTTVEFDPATNAGNYAFAWQAGTQDGNTRVFNLTLADDAGLAGTAFFGFGDDIAVSNGTIKGFICNWAGPGARHNLLDFAQRQGIAQIGDSAVFESVSDTLHIGYAPTTSCEYDGEGTFTYDSDIDGVVDTDPALPIANTLFGADVLLGLTDADGNGVFDEITGAGFVLPLAPENF